VPDTIRKVKVRALCWPGCGQGRDWAVKRLYEVIGRERRDELGINSGLQRTLWLTLSVSYERAPGKYCKTTSMNRKGKYSNIITLYHRDRDQRKKELMRKTCRALAKKEVAGC